MSQRAIPVKPALVNEKIGETVLISTVLVKLNL